MPKIYVDIPKISLTFFITSEINNSIEKKLNTIGFPNIWIKFFSSDVGKKIESLNNQKILYIDGCLDEQFPISEKTQNSSFNATYSSKDKTITLELSGTYLVYEYSDMDSAKLLKGVSHGYIGSIEITDSASKSIKLPKDEYGVSYKLMASASSENIDVYYQVPVSISIEEDS